MKLSEAMREGAKQYGQAYGTLRYDGTNGTVTVCALGAAYVGAFERLPDAHDSVYGADDEGVFEVPYNELRRRFPELSSDNPEYGNGVKGTTLQSAIVELNDTDGKTREQIAEWLESHGL